MKKKIVGLFIAAVVAVNFIAPPAAHAGSKPFGFAAWSKVRYRKPNRIPSPQEK